MALIKVTNITSNKSLSFSGRNNIIHPGESKVFDSSLTAEIQRMEDRGFISTEIIGDPDTIPPVGGFSSLREELNELYQRFNDDRQINQDGFGVKVGE